MITEESLYFRYNIDENGTPISLKIDKENKQVTSAHCTIQLEQVPDELHRVAMFNENGQPMTEVFNRDEIAPNSFYIDYGNGIAYFHSSQSGKFKLYDYYGKGLVMIGSSRIFDEHDVTGKGIVLSLQEMIDKGKECIQTLFYMGDAKKIVDKLDEKINTGTVLHKNLTNDIEIATSLQEDLHSDIVEANTFREQLNQDIANGAVLSSELRQNVIDGENINADLEYNLVEGQGAIDLIRGTGNTAKIITTSDWVGTAPNLSYTWNHGLGTKNLTVEVFDNDTNETLFWTTTLVDNNNIKIESDEAKNIRIVLSAKYHMGGMDTKEEIIAARKGKTDLKTKIDEMDISLEANLNSINSAKEEIIAARKGKNSLKTKIDEIDSLLTEYQLRIQELNTSINNSLQKDSINFSEYGKHLSDISDRFEFVVKYASDNNLRLFIDQDIKLTRPVTLYNNTYIYSNKNKYKVYTEVGSSLNAINLIECYGKKNIVLENIKFQNTGYGQSGSNGINGLFDGFGAGVCFGGCQNITVKDCEFFKCGGYNYSEGSAMLWFSCCQYGIIKNNYFHLGDNAITVDRWYATAPSNSNSFNNGILIEGNLIEHISGRGICIENMNDKGNIIITNNIVTDFGVAGVEGRGFQDVIISNNIFNGDLSLRINPKDFYGLTLSGWDWSNKITTKPKYGIQLISSGDRQLIANNIIKELSTQGVFLGDLTNTLIIGNRIESCGNHSIYGISTTTDSNGFTCTGNSIRDCGQGIKLTTGGDTIKNTKVVINNNNIKVTIQAIVLENTNSTVCESNTIIVDTGDFGLQFNKCNWVKLNNLLICETTSTRVTNGVYFSNCNNVVVDGVINNFSTCITGLTVDDLRGNAILKNSINALSVDTTVTGDGRGFKFVNITGSYKTKGNAFPIVIYSASAMTSVNGYFTIGDLLYYTNPVTSGFLMAVCKVAGSGGTWTNLVPIS